MLEAVADASGGPDALRARLEEDPEVEALVIEGLEAASRTGLEAKRKLLARVLAQAVTDDSKVEESQLIVQALRDIDAPHVRSLARIAAAERREEALLKEERARGETSRVDFWEELLEAVAQEPTSVVAVLVRVGALSQQASFMGGAFGVAGVSDFGQAILRDLRDAGLE